MERENISVTSGESSRSMGAEMISIFANGVRAFPGSFTLIPSSTYVLCRQRKKLEVRQKVEGLEFVGVRCKNSSTLSRRHCNISHTDGAWSITDTSANGVFVNWNRIEFGHAFRLVHGDRIDLGPPADRLNVATFIFICQPETPTDIFESDTSPAEPSKHLQVFAETIANNTSAQLEVFLNRLVPIIRGNNSENKRARSDAFIDHLHNELPKRFRPAAGSTPSTSSRQNCDSDTLVACGSQLSLKAKSNFREEKNQRQHQQKQVIIRQLEERCAEADVGTQQDLVTHKRALHDHEKLENNSKQDAKDSLSEGCLQDSNQEEVTLRELGGRKCTSLISYHSRNPSLARLWTFIRELYASSILPKVDTSGCNAVVPLQSTKGQCTQITVRRTPIKWEQQGSAPTSLCKSQRNLQHQCTQSHTETLFGASGLPQKEQRAVQAEEEIQEQDLPPACLGQCSGSLGELKAVLLPPLKGNPTLRKIQSISPPGDDQTSDGRRKSRTTGPLGAKFKHHFQFLTEKSSAVPKSNP